MRQFRVKVFLFVSANSEADAEALAQDLISELAKRERGILLEAHVRRGSARPAASGEREES